MVDCLYRISKKKGSWLAKWFSIEPKTPTKNTNSNKPKAKTEQLHYFSWLMLTGGKSPACLLYGIWNSQYGTNESNIIKHSATVSIHQVSNCSLTMILHPTDSQSCCCHGWWKRWNIMQDDQQEEMPRKQPLSAVAFNFTHQYNKTSKCVGMMFIWHY